MRCRFALIVKLTVHVANHGDWGRDWGAIVFCLEYLDSLAAQLFDFLFGDGGIHVARERGDHVVDGGVFCALHLL